MPEAPEPLFSATPPPPPKKPKKYLTSGLTIAEYKKLSYQEQRRVTDECTKHFHYETVECPSTGRPILIGRRVKP